MEEHIIIKRPSEKLLLIQYFSKYWLGIGYPNKINTQIKKIPI